jgi:hypothetical protein
MVIDVRILSEWGYSEWLSLGAILGTLTIALIAITTLIRTEKYRKQEYREKRCLEILNWATKVNNFALRHRKEAVKIETEFESYVNSQLHALFDQYEPFRSTSVYTEQVALAIDSRLRDAVTALRSTLQEHIRFLHRIKRGEEKGKNWIEVATKLAKNNNDLHDTAVKVIEAVAKVNTEGL